MYQRPTVPMAWVPAFFGLAIVCVESSAMMSGANTSRWLLDMYRSLWGQTDGTTFEQSHFLLRKLGHFCGYGILGLMFRRGWYRTAPMFLRWTRGQFGVLAAGMAVWSVFGVACMDEWHQSFLPGRVSSVYNVMIDTAGAIVFNVILLFVVARRRRALLAAGYRPWVGEGTRG